ncbi:MAG: integrase core domain-containing protein [Aggregatilineales bacterium]
MTEVFDTIFAAEQAYVIYTPVRAANANAFAERWVRTARNECLDQLLILSQQYLYRMVKAYVMYFNAQRPHQDIDQGPPIRLPSRSGNLNQSKIIPSTSVLGGLHACGGRLTYPF